MLAFYWVGSLALLPLCDFSPIREFALWQFALLLSCGVITLLAYSCFAESLVHIEASRASALIALSPLLTVAIMQGIPLWGLPAEPLGWLSLLGALMVVVGSITTAIAVKAS
jgi:drug/metabolite transporter (DMT)-like permease